MPVYSVAAAAVAIEAPLKWVENLLSRHELLGTPRGVQGSARRLSSETVVHLAIIRELVVAFDIPVARAVEMSAALSRGETVSRTTASRVRVAADVASLRADVERGLSHAMESLITVPRGRPAKKRTRRFVPNE